MKYCPEHVHWKFRRVSTYQNLLDFVELKHVSDYFDLGERISVMAGKRPVPTEIEAAIGERCGIELDISREVAAYI